MGPRAGQLCGRCTCCCSLGCLLGGCCSCGCLAGLTLLGCLQGTDAGNAVQLPHSPCCPRGCCTQSAPPNTPHSCPDPLSEGGGDPAESCCCVGCLAMPAHDSRWSECSPTGCCMQPYFARTHPHPALPCTALEVIPKHTLSEARTPPLTSAPGTPATAVGQPRMHTNPPQQSPLNGFEVARPLLPPPPHTHAHQCTWYSSHSGESATASRLSTSARLTGVCVRGEAVSAASMDQPLTPSCEASGEWV